MGFMKPWKINRGEDVYKEIKAEYDEAFTLAVHKDVRRGIVEDGIRPDGRKLIEIRPLSSEVGLLPRAHGSSILLTWYDPGIKYCNACTT